MTIIVDSRRINSFLRKTRRGHVLKTTHELYLRNDISCGSKLCQLCTNETKILDNKVNNGNQLIPNGHYLVVDTNVVLQQIDLLEDPLFTNVILPQIVLNESLAIYKRIRTLISVPERKFFVFINEFNQDTYILRKAGESPNDRNDRAIRKIVQFYTEHLLQKSTGSNMSIILLTDDMANRDLARADGLHAFTLKEYIQSLNRPELLDRLVLKEESFDLEKNIGKRKEIIFPEHITLSEIQRGLKSGKYLQGTYQASRENYLEANVFVQDSEKYTQLFVQGYRNLNRAIHDDVVAVEILQETEWATPFSLVIDDKDDDQGDLVIEQEETGLVVPGSSSKKQASCRIVGIIKRNWRQYCGILQESVAGAKFHLFVPHERRIPKIRIESRQAEQLKNSRVVVQIDCWPRCSRYPQGHFVKTLGQLGDKDTENEVILAEHDILHHDFPEAVLDCLPQMPWKIMDECGVHIADVTHFVRPNTAIDLEARERGTTVYLVDRRIDMLPVLLSGNLCSLRDGEERLAFSVLWELTPDAEIVTTTFHKSIIKSSAAMTYQHAQSVKDDQGMQNDIAKSLRLLHLIAAKLRKTRMENGALVLESAEVRFRLDTETHDPLDVINKELRETNWLVEEFMLLANISVAKKIYELFPECACLRKHPTPPASNFDPLIKAAEAKVGDFFKKEKHGQQQTGHLCKELAESLDKAVLPDNPYFNTMLRMLATRCMMQAVYFCSGFQSEGKSFDHYGLATPIYTHFTSPIRRYSDIIVHRLLAAGINADVTYPDLLNKHHLQQTCNNLNYRHRMAQYAARASVDLHTQLFFKNRCTDEEGYVLGVRKNALQILLPHYGLETTLFLRDENGKSICNYNEEEATQTIKDVTIRMFDRVTVQISVDRTNLQRQRIQVRLVKPPIDGFSVSPVTKTQMSLDGRDVDDISVPSKRIKLTKK
ncbi:unnamed protein product [Didymodactylos carnosus]|uniref:Protein DIS3 homolog n=1 Tax=Didymodactylos carnosus TaxID=1234261 RepID=A0A813TY82_9BILA|nr:unnamed protein product [Didymodactylos carnosus]CAF0814936.1 unnamed protein product [Didymodactylos carnosus]CAF3505070.1 unnamed protein product [Didymodactylos carnosus]CAF3600950.1 unnamed protein product [Didymodactylos carnosus]